MSVQKFRIRDAPVQDLVSLPIVLTVAGSDSSGGAGIEADLKTFSAHGVFGATCITALTAQNTDNVKSFDKTSQSCLEDIFEMVLKDYLSEVEVNPLKVIKTGMLTTEAVTVLNLHLDLFSSRSVKIVVDPVMMSTSGSSLFDEETLKSITLQLLKAAYLVTPNYAEAISLSKVGTESSSQIESNINCIDDMIEFVKKLQKKLGCENLLVKGGHNPWDSKTWLKASKEQFAENDASKPVVTDILFESKHDKVSIFESSYIKTKNSHGTGCTLSSSIAANLAKGFKLHDAVPLAIDYIHSSIDSMVKLGHGNGPLNHLSHKPEVDVGIVVSSSKSIVEFGDIDPFLNYLKSHPKVADCWKAYTEHEFVRKVATNTLEYERFLYFLKQDYFYLVNYAQVYCLAAAKAPTYQQTLMDSKVVENIVNEIEKHKQKLKNKYNIDFDDQSRDIQPGPACEAYCKYLLDIGNTEDYVSIRTAIAPCLFGYYEAGQFGKLVQEGFLKTYQRGSKEHIGGLSSLSEVEVYESWLDDYVLEWYGKAYRDGEIQINGIFTHQSAPNSQKLDRLVHIFFQVTKLEIAFWDECLGTLPAN